MADGPLVLSSERSRTNDYHWRTVCFTSFPILIICVFFGRILCDRRPHTVEQLCPRSLSPLEEGNFISIGGKHNLPSFLNNNFSVSVTFVSDASVSSSGTDTFYTPYKRCIKGFRLAYQLAPCSRAYNMPHGRILSPSWPHRLPRYYNENNTNEYKDNCFCSGT